MVAPMKRGARAAGEASARGARSAWFTPRAVAKAAGGEVLQGGKCANGVATDSRGDVAGRLFVALRGANFDAHAFLAQVAAAGAAGLVVERVPEDLALLLRQGQAAKLPFVVRVPDTGRALLDLAGEHRRRHRARVVGVTGSCGKTSTKEWLGAVLAEVMPTVRSRGSFNNQVGVPLTLFELQPETRAAVVEIGTNAPGEIAQLTQVVRPDVGIVTCVAPAHLEGLGSVEGVAREKSSLPTGLPSDGLCILNGDDAACRAMAALTPARVELLSVSREADWFATDVRFHALGTTFRLRGERCVTVPRLGTHNVYNALAVIAAASHIGVAEESILASLAKVPSASRRLEPKQAAGVTIFDDTYNMNPTSARAALQALAGLVGSGPSDGRSFVVFGTMLELGAGSEALHRELGAEVVRTGQHALVVVGEGSGPIADGAIAAGMPAARVHRVADVQEALAVLRDQLRSGDRVLCKASRRVALDRLVDRLVAERTAAASSPGTLDSVTREQEN
jgi:UDP-N-acetylmuramoyl-tripeptide--D-alanyl-D-alanine ligase